MPSTEHKDELIKAASVITVAKHKRIYQYNDAIQHVFIVMKDPSNWLPKRKATKYW